MGEYHIGVDAWNKQRLDNPRGAIVEAVWHWKIVDKL